MPPFARKQILDALEKHHQRATYGAVADLVGMTPRSVMQGLPKNRRHSFVVNAESGQPTDYHDLQKHPALLERESVLATGDALRDWLREPS